MLTAITTVTLAAPDLAAVERAYVDYLGYRVVERGPLDAALADAWGTPALAGRDSLLMQPASAAPVYLRVIRQEAVAGFAAMRTHGWNSNEILVADTFAVRERLRGSAFRVIGEPKGLSLNPDIIAMQALGPADEVVYLTRIPEGESMFDLGSAQSFVDRTFIVVLGGPDMEAMRRFYSERLGMPVTATMDSKISVLAAAWDLPAGHDFKLAIVRFPERFLIELDEYPPGATPRPQRAGELPPGMSMVGFSVQRLDVLEVEFVARPRAVAVAPYDGRRVAVTLGAAGEYIELVEA